MQSMDLPRIFPYQQLPTFLLISVNSYISISLPLSFTSYLYDQGYTNLPL